MNRIIENTIIKYKKKIMRTKQEKIKDSMQIRDKTTKLKHQKNSNFGCIIL